MSAASTRSQFRYDPDVGYTFIPNLKLRILHEVGGYLLRTNALGFREDNTPSATPGARPRVFVFGDSYTAGDGVSNGQRFSDLMKMLVPELEFFNFGLPGTGTDQQFIAFEKFAAPLSCDLVVVCVLVENIRRIVSRFSPVYGAEGITCFQAKPYFSLEDDALVRHNHPVPEGRVPCEAVAGDENTPAVDRGGRFPGLRKAIVALGLRETVQKLTGYQPVPDYDSSASSAWQLMRAILVAWRKACRARFLVVPIPLYQHVEETASADAYVQRFRELTANDGIAVHDVLADLRRYGATERRRFRFETDVHLTPEGHTAVARSLAPAIRSMMSLTTKP